jgi:hypothetical protein
MQHRSWLEVKCSVNALSGREKKAKSARTMLSSLMVHPLHVYTQLPDEAQTEKEVEGNLDRSNHIGIHIKIC